MKNTYDLSDLVIQLLKENKQIKENRDSLIRSMIGDSFTGKTLGVPDEIPASLLVSIQKLGYDVKVVDDLLPDARATKTSEEIKSTWLVSTSDNR